MMTTTHIQLDPSTITRESLESLSWAQRLQLAKELAEQITDEGASEEIVAVLRLLAGDTKWEVRTEVADLLLLLPEGDFPEFVAALRDDCNAFVQRAVQRAQDQRHRKEEAAKRKRRSLDQIENQYVRIEKAHGGAVARKARRMAERLYDVLVGATVHDMRSMVSPLLASVTSLQGKLHDGHIEFVDLLKHLPRMRRQAEQINRTLDDMAAYAQCLSGERQRERVQAIVEEAVAAARAALRAADRLPDQVRLEIDVPGNLTFVVARDHILRCITNIVKNAYEAFAVSRSQFRPGTVRVNARQIDRRRLQIVVEDNGLGLSEDDLAQVRRFLPGGTTKAGFGTGFGLPMARRMIAAHGGTLAIDSRDGAGTTIIITMPITPTGEVP